MHAPYVAEQCIVASRAVHQSFACSVVGRQRIKASENSFAANIQSTRIFLRKTIHVNQTYATPPFSEFSRLEFHPGQLKDQSHGSGKSCCASAKQIGSIFVCRLICSGPVVNNVVLETN